MSSGDLFMCVPAVQDSASDGSGRISQSFEEIRTLDYLRFYQLTGRAPPACPAEPPGEAERAALGLPPLWVPWRDPRLVPAFTQPLQPPIQPPIQPGPILHPLQPRPHPHPLQPQQPQQIFAPHPVVLGSPQLAAQPRPVAYPLSMDPVMRYRPEELPRVQVCTPVTLGTDTYESIVCAPTFAWYSFEELRYFAYLRGLKHITASIPTPPIAEVSNTSPLGPAPTLIINEEVNETMDHICAHPAFSKHSPEEHRLAFMRTGRELASQ